MHSQLKIDANYPFVNISSVERLYGHDMDGIGSSLWAVRSLQEGFSQSQSFFQNKKCRNKNSQTIGYLQGNWRKLREVLLPKFLKKSCEWIWQISSKKHTLERVLTSFRLHLNDSKLLKRYFIMQCQVATIECVYLWERYGLLQIVSLAWYSIIDTVWDHSEQSLDKNGPLLTFESERSIRWSQKTPRIGESCPKTNCK